MGMPKKERRALTIWTLSFFTFFSIMQISGWHLMKLFGAWGGGRFLDTKQVLHWVDCYESVGKAIFDNSGECSGYIYGSTLISAAKFLGIREYHTMQVGFFLLLILSFSLAWILNLVKIRENRIFAGLILLSPPVLLLAERGNIDILMFLLILVSAWMFNSDKKIIGVLLLALACIVKFYAFPLFIVYVFYTSKKKVKIFITVVATAVLVRIFLDLRLIESSFPQIWGAQFGMSIWLRYAEKVGYYPSEIVTQISGLAVFIFICVVIRQFYSIKLRMSGYSSQKEFYFLVFFSVHLTCFLLGMSFDYRLVFLLASALFFLDLMNPDGIQRTRIIQVLTLCSVWFVYESWVFQVVGDLTTEILTAILLFPFFRILLAKSELVK